MNKIILDPVQLELSEKLATIASNIKPTNFLDDFTKIFTTQKKQKLFLALLSIKKGFVPPISILIFKKKDGYC